MNEDIDTQITYDSLKDFQYDTVEFVYKKLQKNSRYLVADEVGLGKTMVAKGIIAKIYDELRDKKGTIEIIYITTNQSIASQNIETLKIGNSETTSHRLTLHVTKPKNEQKMNFMSFTVGTSIEIRGPGNHEEREFLVYLLRDSLLKGIHEETIWDFFRGGVDKDKTFRNNNNFRISRKYLREKFKEVDEDFINKFANKVEENQDLFNIMGNIRNFNLYIDDAYSIIEILRKILLVENINKIKPNLIIMDEFQRFNKILVNSTVNKQEKNDDLDEIMKMFFKQNSKILLLSATPYKLLECKNNEHYDEFYNLIEWLLPSDNQNKINELKRLFDNISQNIKAIEEILKEVMCRTERVSSIDNSMMKRKEIHNLNLNMTMNHYFNEYSKYAKLNITSLTRYLKSAPSALNYMNKNNYLAKREFLELEESIKSKIKENKHHPKFKMLEQEVENQNLKENIWMPPINPYVKSNGENNSLSTKILIFSHWDFVPDSIVGGFSTKYVQSNYTDKSSFIDRDKLLLVDMKNINPYDYNAMLSFTSLINDISKKCELSKIEAKILLGSPANVIYRSIKKYGEIEDLEKLKYYIEPKSDRNNYIENENLESFSHIFLHYLGKKENRDLIKLKPNEGSKVRLEKILDYCIEHNIQSMMDEYIHLLTDSPRYKNITKNKNNTKDENKIFYLLDIFKIIFTIRPNEIISYKYENNEDLKNLRTSKFAMRISKSSMTKRSDSEKPPTADNVKISFNSPFAPFILATTSIGQEGLDFHPYCHQIWHWDLPSNPVDLEQREGRIHRYKNYAVRKNIALKYNDKCWIKKFSKAREEKLCDFKTFWIYTDPDKEEQQQYIERVLPLLPLSRESSKYKQLEEQLDKYRSAIGQRSQKDILEQDKNNNVRGISLKPPELLKER